MTSSTGHPASSTEDLTQRGIAAVQAGNTPRAFELLTQALALDPHNERAWLWLSGAVGTDAERKFCLERVLGINPDHAAARRGLTILPLDVVSQAPAPFLCIPNQASADLSAATNDLAPPEPPCGPLAEPPAVAAFVPPATEPLAHVDVLPANPPAAEPALSELADAQALAATDAEPPAITAFVPSATEPPAHIDALPANSPAAEPALSELADAQALAATDAAETATPEANARPFTGERLDTAMDSTLAAEGQSGEPETPDAPTLPTLDPVSVEQLDAPDKLAEEHGSLVAAHEEDRATAGDTVGPATSLPPGSDRLDGETGSASLNSGATQPGDPPRRDHRKQHEKFMKTNWNVAAIVAWRGYLKEGRGAVAIVCRSAWSPLPGTPWSFGPTHDAYYIPYSVLQEQDTEAWPGAEGIAALTSSYNPEREVVFIFFRDDRGVSVYRMEPHKGLPPPAAYARWQAGHVPATGALGSLRRLANFITQLTAL